jgi:hypothetical protein
MQKDQYIDYHIELSSIIEFINENILTTARPIFDRDTIFEVIKKVVISSNEKPFLYENCEGFSKEYFEGYFERAKYLNPNTIPDFFEYRNEFYDLDNQIYIYRDRTDDESFMTLFIINLLVIQKNGWDVSAFLNFQLQDNFHDNKYYYFNFLHRIIRRETNQKLFSSIITPIVDLVESAAYAGNIIEEDIEPEVEEVATYISGKQIDSEANTYEWNEYLNSRKEFVLSSTFSLQETQHFFSFLYNEKSVGGKGFLPKKQVEKIFKDGLKIPKEPLQHKFKLNVDFRYPKKLVDAGIHKFYNKHSNQNIQKKELLLFLGSYIEDYSKVFESKNALETQSKNIRNYTEAGKRIVWNKYLPSKHH